MNHHRQKPPLSWGLISVFIIVSAILLFLGILLIRYQKNSFLKEKESELAAVANLKSGQINLWKSERIGDANLIQNNLSTTDQIYNFLNSKDSLFQKNELVIWMRSIISNYDYLSAAIIDTHGKVRLSIPESESGIGPLLRPHVQLALKTKKIIFTDLHRTSVNSIIHIDVVIPMVKSNMKDSLLVGLVVLRIDPEKILYPLVRTWPTLSKSSETLLLRREGDSILYLNDLKYIQHSAMYLKKSLEKTDLIGVKAVLGFEGKTEGVDYRNVEVIASIKKVPDSEWYMVSKVDKEEIINLFSEQLLLARLMIVFFIVAFGAVIGWAIWHRRVRFYKQKYDAELDRMAVRKHFDYILKYANDIIILYDKDLLIVEVNDRVLEVYKYTRKELIGMHARTLRDEKEAPQLEARVKILNDIGYSRYETIHKIKDGSTFPIEISARKVEIEGATYYQVIGRDISERRISEIQKENSNSLLLATLESTADGILVVDPSGKIVQFNTKFTEMWKIPEVILNSREDEKALSYVRDQLKDPASFLNNVKHLYSQPDAVSFDVLEFADGRLFERYSQPQKIGDEIIGRVWSFRDVTLRKIAEDQLVSAKEKAEESDRLKTAFLHNISHEIRTPMNAIVGFTTLLDDSDLQPDTRKQYIDIIFQSSNQLLSIITDIVDISNIETGQTKVSIVRVNINSVIRNLFDQFKLRAEQQGIAISYHLSLKDEEAIIETDNTKLIQIMSNLLNNSLKFTKSGKIDFGYHIKNGSVEFHVSDTGIGIPKDKISKIFERFYQVESSISRQFGGTGLGLSICQAYASLLDGIITVESKLGVGSTFYLTLPFNTFIEDVQKVDYKDNKSNLFFMDKTLLVAEDDDINFLVIKKSLEPNGFKLIRVENGKEAVDICRTNKSIDLVLLDLKMPVMDGLEAMKLIKEFRPDMIFVALSAYAFDSDRRNALDQGCSDYISKPFAKKELLEVLGKYL
jgi:PAS domain S-box-containing protein